ncbi:hypothetical protein ACJX0J_015610, partial [Zea mays]
ITRIDTNSMQATNLLALSLVASRGLYYHFFIGLFDVPVGFGAFAELIHLHIYPFGNNYLRSLDTLPQIDTKGGLVSDICCHFIHTSSKFWIRLSLLLFEMALMLHVIDLLGKRNSFGHL